MKNTHIARIMQRANKPKNFNSAEIHLAKEYIQLVANYLQPTIKQNHNISAEELRMKVLNHMAHVTREYCNVANFAGIYYQIEAAHSMLNNKQIITDIYEELQNTQNNKYPTGIYTANIHNSYKELVSSMIKQINEQENRLDPLIIKDLHAYNMASEKEKKEIEKRYSQTKQNVINFRRLARFADGSMPDRIYAKLEEDVVDYQEELKGIIIKIMNFLEKEFTTYGLFEKYQKNYETTMKNIGMSEYCSSYSTNQYQRDNIGLKELFSEKFLETLDLEDIMMLSLFWQNRYSKECKNIGQAISSIDTLDLWNDIMSGKTDFSDISDSTMNGILNKMGCLETICSNMFKTLESSYKKSQEDYERGFHEIPVDETIEKIAKQEGKNYKMIFNNQLPGYENNLRRDLDTHHVLLNRVENIYIIRNNILGMKIRSLFDSKKCKNWGVFEKELEDKEGQTINDKHYVLIGIDQEGFNMPIRLHIKKELLLNFLRTYNGESILPIYEGPNDFTIGPSWVATNVLMPMTKQQKTFLNHAYKTTNSNQPTAKLIAHLRFLKDADKYPEHLKREIQTGSTKKKVRPPRRYIDLKSGKTFYKQNGTYVEEFPQTTASNTSQYSKTKTKNESKKKGKEER